MSCIRRKKPSRVRPVRGRSGRCCERLSIQSHLAYCELKLRLRTRPGQITRLRLLDHLHRYWRAGCFPENRLHASGRWPVFIDDSGTYCAVGHLMAQSGAQGLAAAINRDNRFVYIEDLDLDQHPEIRSWLLKHELSQTEAALIQPTYLGPMEIPNTGSLILTGILVFWLICVFGPLRLAINLIRKARELQHCHINPITTTHRHEEDTKPIELVHPTWNNNFSLFRKRFRRYSTLIITLNLALMASLAFITGLVELDRRTQAAKVAEAQAEGDPILAVELEDSSMFRGIPSHYYQVLIVVTIGLLVFELIFTLKWRLLVINLRRKARELQHGINQIATTRWHEEDTKPEEGLKPIESTHRIWNNDFFFLRKRLRCYAGLIIPLNLAFMTSLVCVAILAYINMVNHGLLYTYSY